MFKYFIHKLGSFCFHLNREMWLLGLIDPSAWGHLSRNLRVIRVIIALKAIRVTLAARKHIGSSLGVCELHLALLALLEPYQQRGQT